MKKIKKIKLRKRHKFSIKIKIKKLFNVKKIFMYLILIFSFILIIIFSTKLVLKRRNIEIFGKYYSEFITYKGEIVEKKKLIEDYLSRIKENDRVKYKERFLLYKYFYLDDYSENDQIKSKIKSKFITIMKSEKMNKIEILYLQNNNNFGNNLIAINNVIFYCEVVRCNKILLKDQGTSRKWLITNPINIQKLNLTIMLGTANCNDENVLCFREGFLDPFFVEIVRPQIRTQYLKEELLRNLPNVKTEPNDLYIHIRGGDIFDAHPVVEYAQPPLCFYDKIIEDNKFNNIHIVAMDKRNIMVDTLINKYKKIIFETHDYVYDLSLLVHAYKIAMSVSSFAISAIKFNDNLKDIWEYDIYRLSEKFVFLHHHLYKFDIKFKIHTMKSSDIYADKMFKWENSKSQLDLMINDKCIYDFAITKPNR